MDQITTISEISDVSAELILNVTQQFLEQAMVLAPTLSDYSSLVQPGMKQIAIPRAAKFQPQKKNSATNLNSQTVSITTDDLALDQHYGVLAEIEELAAVQSNIDLMVEYAKRMAAALALQMDGYIYDQMKLTSSSSPDHRVAFAAGSSLTKADFTVAKKLLRIQNVPMNDGQLYLAINPYNEKAILDLADFVDADKWLAGSESAKMNGLLGKAYGFNIVVSNVVDDTGCIFYHKSHVAWARQIQPKLESQRDIRNLSDLMAMSHNYGAKVLDAGVRGVLIGSAS